jgi:DNA-binding MarR family transcriptional regulator
MTVAPRPPLMLESFLPYRLNVLAAVVSEGLSRLYAERFGLDIAQWRVLATLGAFHERTATDIGQHSHMNKTRVSRALADLEGRGLVARVAADGDQRKAIVRLTVEGRAVYEAIVPLALAYERKLLATLTATDRAALERALTGLTRAAAVLGRPEADPAPPATSGPLTCP